MCANHYRHRGSTLPVGSRKLWFQWVGANAQRIIARCGDRHMIRRFIYDRAGSSAAEFALVLPLLLIFLLGIVDAGRWLWTLNRAEKAAQMGARFAVDADPVTSAVSSSYLGVDGLT